jgi:hypothetical protein
MNNDRQENGAPSGPLIFTLPASSFIVILNFGWLDGIKPEPVSGKRTPATRPVRAADFAEALLRRNLLH